MAKARASDRTDKPSRNRSAQIRIILGIVAPALVGVILVFAVTSNNKSGEQDSAPGRAPSEPEPICRADGQFVAGFMSPQVDDADTDAMLERMNTDAVTFGGRIMPATAEDYPDSVDEPDIRSVSSEA